MTLPAPIAVATARPSNGPAGSIPFARGRTSSASTSISATDPASTSDGTLMLRADLPFAVLLGGRAGGGGNPSTAQ